MRLGRYLTLLRHNRAFARLFGAQLVSFAGDWFATVALLGLALELTGSPSIAAGVLVVQTGAFALASPVAGGIADRYDRRRLMVVAGLARVPAILKPTSPASLPNLVDDEDLADANVLSGSTWGVMLAVGAALGGIVAATLGRDVAFIVNAASFALSARLVG